MFKRVLLAIYLVSVIVSVNPGQACGESPCQCVVGTEANQKVDCAAKQICLKVANMAACVGTIIYEEGKCQSHEFCGCAASSAVTNDKVADVCSKGETCFLLGQKSFCGRNLITLEAKCNSADGCTCHDGSANQPPTASVHCSKDTTCMKNGNSLGCFSSVIGAKAQCQSGDCLCKIQVTPNNFRTTVVQNGAYCTQVGEAAVSSTFILALGGECITGKCLCKHPSKDSDNKQCEPGKFCGVDFSWKQIVCFQLKIQDGDLCPKGGPDCLCGFREKPQKPPTIDIAPINAGNYCIREDTNLRNVPMRIFPGISCPSTQSTCMCVHPTSSAKNVKCNKNQACLMNADALQCVAIDGAHMQACTKNECVCKATSGKVATCPQSKFCFIDEEQPFCYTQPIKQNAECADSYCLCQAGQELPGAWSVAVCKQNDICIPSYAHENMLCHPKTRVATSGQKIAEKSFTCQVTGQGNKVLAVGCRKGDSCMDIEGEPTCAEKTLKHLELCDKKACRCQAENQESNKDVGCRFNEQCVVKNGAATCMRRIIQVGSICEDPKGCSCISHSELFEGKSVMREAVSCAKSKICGKNYDGPLCLDMLKNTDVIQPSYTYAGVACAYPSPQSAGPYVFYCPMSYGCKFGSANVPYCADSDKKIMMEVGKTCMSFNGGCKCKHNQADVSCRAGEKCVVGEENKPKCVKSNFDYFMCPKDVYCSCSGYTIRSSSKDEWCVLKEDGKHKLVSTQPTTGEELTPHIIINHVAALVRARKYVVDGVTQPAEPLQNRNLRQLFV